MESIVSDTTALIVLAKQDRLDLLEACFEHVLLPDAVYREWLAGDATIERTVQRLEFLHVVAVEDSGLLAELRALLDPGEAEALALAEQRGLTLLVDEKKGRSIARMMGIPVLGLVGILLLAVRRGGLEPETAREIVQQAMDHGFRLSDRLYGAFLERLGLR
jgi:predicted nucleic acid-binding protein